MNSLVFFHHENAEDCKDHSGTNPDQCGNDDVVIVFSTCKTEKRAVLSLYCTNETRTTSSI